MYAPETLPKPGWTSDELAAVSIAPEAARLDPVARYQLTAWDRSLISGSPNTVPIWILAALPMVAIALQFIAMASSARMGIQLAVGSFFVLACIALPVWDRAALSARNIDGPSWWWLLLGSPVTYLIVRSLKLARDGVSADGPAMAFFVGTAALAALVITSALLGI